MAGRMADKIIDNMAADMSENMTENIAENMTGSAQESRYEALYTVLLGRAQQLHEGNRKRIRRGLALLVVLPVILEFIRRVTDSDKIVFLIIWVLIMFAVSAYLISVEYLDSSVEAALRSVAGGDGDGAGPDSAAAETAGMPERSAAAETEDRLAPGSAPDEKGDPGKEDAN